MGLLEALSGRRYLQVSRQHQNRVRLASGTRLVLSSATHSHQAPRTSSCHHAGAESLRPQPQPLSAAAGGPSLFDLLLGGVLGPPGGAVEQRARNPPREHCPHCMLHCTGIALHCTAHVVHHAVTCHDGNALPKQRHHHQAPLSLLLPPCPLPCSPVRALPGAQPVQGCSGHVQQPGQGRRQVREAEPHLAAWMGSAAKALTVCIVMAVSGRCTSDLRCLHRQCD